MKRYWPNAIALDAQGDPIHLFNAQVDNTFGYETMDKAEEAFIEWQNNGFTLLATWIEMNGNINRHRVHVGFFGDVEKYKKTKE